MTYRIGEALAYVGPRACLLKVHPLNLSKVVQKSARHDAFPRTGPKDQQAVFWQGLEEEQGLRVGGKIRLAVVGKLLLKEIYS